MDAGSKLKPWVIFQSLTKNPADNEIEGMHILFECWSESIRAQSSPSGTVLTRGRPGFWCVRRWMPMLRGEAVGVIVEAWRLKLTRRST